MQKYDVVIIGGGPAGYTAALYCARAALSCAVVESIAPGGQMGTTDQVDNYPGFEDGVNGFDLAMRMQKQAERFGAKTHTGKVVKLELQGDTKQIVLQDNSVIEASAVILSMGAYPRELGLEEERTLRGRGVSYCATCDGMFYRGKTVVVVGGGDTAAADTVFLSKICKKVYLVHRRDSMRASKAYLNPLEACENVEFLWNSEVKKINADPKVTSAVIVNRESNEERTVETDGVFVAVGNIPNTSLVQEQVELNKAGYILAGEDTKTNIPGVFAAGDLRQKSLRQIVTAVSDGAVAAYMAEEYLSAEKV